MDNMEKSLISFLVIILIVIVSSIIGSLIQLRITHESAIQNNVGEYNAKTGEFQWINPNKFNNNSEAERSTETDNP